MKEGILTWFLFEVGLFITVMAFFYGLMQVYGNPWGDWVGILIAFIVFMIAHKVWHFIALPLGIEEWEPKK